LESGVGCRLRRVQRVGGRRGARHQNVIWRQRPCGASADAVNPVKDTTICFYGCRSRRGDHSVVRAAHRIYVASGRVDVADAQRHHVARRRNWHGLQPVEVVVALNETAYVIVERIIVLTGVFVVGLQQRFLVEAFAQRIGGHFKVGQISLR
jgi:hypothetical protein